MDLFHRHRQAGEHDCAAVALERALQVPEYRPEALIWKGIEALPKDPQLAFLFLGNAADSFPKRADVHALIGRSLIAQAQPALASRYLSAIWQKMPNDPALRMMLWQARSQSEDADTLQRIILAHLPDITSAQELAFVLKLLASKVQFQGAIGVVRYLPDVQEIHGWAVNLANVQAVPALQLEANGRVVNMAASAPHPLLAAAGLPASHGGIRIKVPNATPAVQVRFESGPALLGSPIYAMPAFVPPPASSDVGAHQPVDVLIPVYNGLEETLECINSALDARKLNRTPHRLVVIEDATPVPALRKALKVLAGKSKITLVQNPVNLGFIRSMNRAMAMSPTRDVVWLNADTRVHGDWLDRLRAVAYSDEVTASVTPFTNNGELMSFPQSRISQPMPSAQEQAELDELAKQTDSCAVEIETGCGFCLYLKREAINQVGYLDEVDLLRGYGEETDWCLRARGFGWKHMGAPGVFVAHQGGVSFGEEKLLRVASNNAILRRRYPDAEARYENFCRRDPIKPARQALQRARLTRWLAQNANLKGHFPQVLHLHDGSLEQTEFSLTWHHDGLRSWITLHAQLHPLEISLDYTPADFPMLMQDLCGLPLAALVFDQLANCPPELLKLPSKLQLPYRIICSDDELLKQQNSDWLDFAQAAQSIELPWQALRSRYMNALPSAPIAAPNTASKDCAGQPAAGKVLMIGDSISNGIIAEGWLGLARQITKLQLPIKLLMKGNHPWNKQLLATGAIQVLPELHRLSFAENAVMAGCQAVLSLDDNPGAGWQAPRLAKTLGLPLYAPPGLIADEVGALSLHLLPISPSRSDVKIRVG
ncbi:glycosyltransferase family 2 protein [Pseudomonas capeferrum]|uniref:glycosyltransferase family 2 protein n=1 Tax=Pseudomonas capeferrum TaxID=1495066 RepID=UPI0015E2830C|nr:glycosyltransferase family 2 protein [Pseudomonas capeferrum]MBA1204430.1 glycosyltransferase family 2 protein [Pseudomonas capeferrum]